MFFHAGSFLTRSQVIKFHAFRVSTGQPGKGYSRPGHDQSQQIFHSSCLTRSWAKVCVPLSPPLPSPWPQVAFVGFLLKCSYLQRHPFSFRQCWNVDSSSTRSSPAVLPVRVCCLPVFMEVFLFVEEGVVPSGIRQALWMAARDACRVFVEQEGGDKCERARDLVLFGANQLRLFFVPVTPLPSLLPQHCPRDSLLLARPEEPAEVREGLRRGPHGSPGGDRPAARPAEGARSRAAPRPGPSGGGRVKASRLPLPPGFPLRARQRRLGAR